MYLQRLVLKDFRAFRDVAFDLPPEGVVLVAGPNNAGKTSILSAFDVLAGQGMPPYFQHIGGSPPRILARFAFSGASQERIIPADSADSLGAPRWLEWEFTSEGGGPVVAVEVRGSWFEDQDPLVMAHVESDRQGWRVLHRAWPTRLLHSEEPPLTTLAQSRSPGVVNLDSIDVPSIRLAKMLLAEWRREYFRFPALRPGTERTRTLESTSVLQATGGNLPAVLLDLQNNRPFLWRSLQDHLAQIVPGVGRLALRTSGTQVEVVFDDPHVTGHRHNLKDLGAGVEQLLLMLVIGLATPEATTVAIEEPETGLHPAAQRAMLALLHTWAKNRVFIMTTHSPVLLDTEHGTPFVLSVRRDETESTVSRLKPVFHDLLADLGVRLSDVHSSDRILLVEGPSDRDALYVWRPELLGDPRVSVITGQGGRNARFAKTLDEWLRQADRLERKILYIRDRDELNARQIQQLEAHPTVYILRRRELENYFLDPEALSAFLASEAKAEPVHPDQIEKQLREAADSLKSRVTMKSVAQTLETIYLVDDRLRGRLAASGAGVDELVAAVLDRVPDRALLETQIRDAWCEVEAEVSKRWEADWRTLAPGEEVLDDLLLRHLGRRFSKSKDGVALARMVQPRELLDVVDDFLRR